MYVCICVHVMSYKLGSVPQPLDSRPSTPLQGLVGHLYGLRDGWQLDVLDIRAMSW